MACAAVLVAISPGPAAAAGCPNAQFRTGYSASLPDCRAYELVSPPNKGGNDAGYAILTTLPTRSAASGDTVIYGSTAALGPQPGSNFNEYVATRGPGSWSATSSAVPQKPSIASPGTLLGLSGDLSKELVLTNAALTPDAVPGQQSVYLYERDRGTGTYHLIGTDTSGSTWQNNYPTFDGASADGGHLLFDTSVALSSTPAPPSGASDNLYDWTGGQLKLVGVLPDGTADANGSQAGHGADAPFFHTISTDASRVYWSEPGGGATPIYLRQNDATTTAITVSQRTGAGSTPQPGVFWAATADGSKAYFTSTSQLTNQTSVNYGGSGDLYEYDVASRTLTDITADMTASDPTGASVYGVVGVGSSASGGTYVYFVAQGVLTSGPNSRGQTASPGGENLYVWHDSGSTASTRLVAPNIRDSNLGASAGNSSGEIEEVSPDGAHLTIATTDPLTGYNNTDVSTGSADAEVFLYNAGTDALACASCNPSGAAPTGAADLHAQLATSADLPDETFSNVSDSGRLFFESPDQLLPQDTNRVRDVYEFEQDGVGSCSQAQGCLSLISSGRSSTDSFFGDASANGNDVFLLTYQQLVGQDTDQNMDVYDARVDGGYPPPPPPPTPCTADGCHGQPAGTPQPPTAVSVTFSGPGDQAPPARISSIRVRALTKVVHGMTFVVRVRVPAKGRVTIAGASITTVRRSLSRAGTYGLRVSLQRKARGRLRGKHRLKLLVQIAYAPAGGRGAATTITLTDERQGKR